MPAERGGAAGNQIAGDLALLPIQNPGTRAAIILEVAGENVSDFEPSIVLGPRRARRAPDVRQNGVVSPKGGRRRCR